MKKIYDLFGLGSAIMDVLMAVDDTELLKYEIGKGVMKLIDEPELVDILKKIHHLNPVMSPGGSVANTCAGIVRLGGKSIFCGVVGNDKDGILYEEKMRKDGVEVRISKEDDKGHTATAITFITPDSERSFATHLGVALKTAIQHIVEEDIASSKIAHFEGYMLESRTTKDACIHAMKTAKKHNTLISIDVSDAGLIKRTLPHIKDTIREYADILFLNDMEVKALTGKDYSEAYPDLRELADIVIIKLGKEGSIILRKDEEARIKGLKVDAVDTTGAGDMYAAGFLFGIAKGLSLISCGKIANLAASKVVERIGARLDYDLKQDIKNIISS